MPGKTSQTARKRVAILIPSDCKAHRDRIAGILRYFVSHPHLEAVLTDNHVAVGGPAHCRRVLQEELPNLVAFANISGSCAL